MEAPKTKKTFRLKKRITEDIEISKQFSGDNSRNLGNTQNKKVGTVIAATSSSATIANINPSFKRSTTKPGATDNSFQSKIAEKDKDKEKDNTLESQRSLLQEEIVYNPEVHGAQLKFNKDCLSFVERTGNVAYDSIVLTNIGTNAVYYRWRKVDVERYFHTALYDKNQRFYCHSGKSVIKPGETRKFYFSFRSKSTGIFDEEWMLECEPVLVTPLQRVKLTGHAIEEDQNIPWQGIQTQKPLLTRIIRRKELDEMIEVKHKGRFVSEIINDIFDNVRSPTPPLPDLNDPVICKREFEEKNKRHRLYYTPLIINLFRNLEQLVYEELNLKPEQQYWDMDAEYFKPLIFSVKDDFHRECLERRYEDIFDLARKQPYDRSAMFQYFKEIVIGLAKEIPNTSATIRKEKDMLDYIFQEPIDMTPEDLKKKQDEEVKARAELYKKLKKKPRTDEEEKNVKIEYKNEFIFRTSTAFKTQIANTEADDQYVRASHILSYRDTPKKDYFEFLGRKKSILDMDIEGKRLVLRIHLVKKKQIIVEQPPKEEEKVPEVVVNQKELPSKGKDNVKGGKGAQEKNPSNDKSMLSDKSKEPLKQHQQHQQHNTASNITIKQGVAQAGTKKKEPEKKPEDDPKVIEANIKAKAMQLIEESSLTEAITIIKYCLDHLAKLVIVLISFGEAHGIINPNNSIKFFYEYLKLQVEQPCMFDSASYIPNLQEKLETEAYPENSALILENLYFQPEEIGYIYNEEQKLIRVEKEAIDQYKKSISQYSTYWILEDRYNVFTLHSSIIGVNCDFYGMGLAFTSDIQLASQCVLHASVNPTTLNKRSTRNKPTQEEERKIAIALVGGDLNGPLFVALDTMLDFYDTFIMLGKVGLYFFMNSKKLTRLGDYTLDRMAIGLIEKFIQKVQDKKKSLIVPSKFMIAMNPGIPETNPEWLPKVIPTKQPWGYSADTPLPEGAIFIDYDPEYMREITEMVLAKARNIMWIDNLGLMKYPELNETCKTIAIAIYNRQEDKKKILGTSIAQQDYLVGMCGADMPQLINSYEIVPVPLTQQMNMDDKAEKSFTIDRSQVSMISGGEDDNEEANKKKEKKVINNIPLVADIFTPNTLFVLRLISGNFVRGLSSLTGIEKKTESEMDEEFSFIDEIQVVYWFKPRIP